MEAKEAKEPKGPTAGWKKLFNRFYQKRTLYKMAWNVNLEECGVAGASFGGPLALTTGHAKAQTIQLFSSDGVEIGSFLWDKTRVVKMGWSLREELVLVLEDGMVMLYSIFGDLINQFSLSIGQHKVADVQIWGEGLVAMTNFFQFVAVEDLSDPTPVALKDPQLESPPCSWLVVEPRFTPHRSVEVLVATTGGTIIAVTKENANDCYLSNGPFSKMSLSPRGNMLACFTQTGSVWVTPPTFKGKHYSFNTKSATAPMQLVWCGGDTVVCTWKVKENDRLLLVVGPHDSWIRFHYNEPLYLIPECDGVRVVSQRLCEFLQLVPDVTEEIFKVGSTESAAVLFDAMEHFENKSPKADELIRRITQKKELAIAVKKCITAASYEFHPEMQKKLLKAASFGKCFVDFYNPDFFVDTCKTLRVLNVVRFHGIGMPITFEQFQMLSSRVLVDRLVNRHHHLMAKCICTYLDIKPDRILVHWACAKVRSSEPDDVILRAIVDKLSEIPGISYAEIACAAYKISKPTLATKLLDYEPRAADQVPLLLSMHYDTIALAKAIESGDTDLMYLVLLHIKRNKKEDAEFINIISKQKQAMNLFLLYCKEQDVQLLGKIYRETGQVTELAKLQATAAFNMPDSEPAKMKAMEASAREYGRIREKTFEARVLEDQARLMHLQKAMETDLGQPFFGLSVTNTVYKLLQLEQGKKAANMQKDFRIPDARFWWIKIRALASTGQWDRLYKFSKEKKSPIGYGPFAEICMKHRMEVEAAKYVPRISHPGEKAEYLMKLGAFKEAAAIVAKELRDPNLLLAIRKEAAKDDPSALPAIDQMLAKFQ